jgi:hypothetical protein
MAMDVVEYVFVVQEIKALASSVIEVPMILRGDDSR